jgi:hypothetical protein
MNPIPSYPKVYNLGHPALEHLLDGPVSVEEKIDGSQFSFMLGDQLYMRSKNAAIYTGAPAGMFAGAVRTAEALADQGLLTPGYIYRGEALAKPRHNVLAYDRVPKGNIILFDVEVSPDNLMPPADRRGEAERLGLECVPVLYEGVLDSLEFTQQLLDTTSILGGQKVEGVVVKNRHVFGVDGKVLMGKHVSTEFREVHKATWKTDGPKDIIEQLIDKYKTTARWLKAVQHLAESGALERSPRDIGPLIKEVQGDLKEECAESIMQDLFVWAWPKLQRAVTRGLPEWYKDQLLQQQFEQSQAYYDEVLGGA